MTGGWGISCKIALRWMSLDLTDDKSTLVQVMAWCHQATSHYLGQCWPRFMSPYGVTRPQWVKCWRGLSNFTTPDWLIYNKQFPRGFTECMNIDIILLFESNYANRNVIIKTNIRLSSIRIDQQFLCGNSSAFHMYPFKENNISFY